MNSRSRKVFIVLVLVVALVLPTIKSQGLVNYAEPESSSHGIADLGLVADPMAPLGPDIEYSGDPGGAYLPEPAPTGPQTLIVLLVYFSDLSYTESASTLNSLIFGNVSDYYSEVSYGQCSLSGTVAGWYNLGHTKAYYGADGATSGATDDTNDDGSNDSWRLVDDALAAADPSVDFSLYGHIMVLHAGNGQESSGVSDDIWSVRWSWPGHFVTNEKTFNSCSIVPETQGGDVDRCIGVIAHEFGHDIGLPDLYHYGHAGEDDFVDQWGLMASGSWNGIPSGTSPAHPMAYCKIALEWITNYYEFTIDSNHYDIRIYDQETYTTSPQAIKLVVSSNTYYLIELRSDYGYDSYLPSTGVLISYCDESLGSGQGIVKVQDAHPGTLTLDDAVFEPGDSFLSDKLRIEVNFISPTGDYANITIAWSSEEWIADQFVGAQNTEVERNPDIASDSVGNLYCAFETWNVDWGTYVIEVRKSIDGGRTWAWLFAFGSSTYDSFNPAIAVDIGFYDTVFVVCEMEISALDHNIYGYAYNSTGGQFLYIDTDAENDRYPCIASEFSFGPDNWQYVAYERVVSSDDRDMVVQRSDDHGDSWSVVLQRGNILDWNVYCDLSIACTRGSDSQYYVYVAYKYGADYSTGYSIGVDVSSDYGTSWTQRWVYTGSSQEVHYTSIAAGHGTGTVVIGWHQTYSTGDNDIWVAYSTDNGVNWDSQWIAYTALDETSVDVGVDGQGESLATVDSAYFHVVYRVGNDVIYTCAASTRPSVWSPAEVVNSGGYASATYPMLAVTAVIRESGDRYPAIVWTDIRGSYDIYYSTRGGTVTFATEPSGLNLTIDSVTYSTEISFEWIAGMLISFNAPFIQNGTQGIRYVWGYWDFGGSTSSSQTIMWACDPYNSTITAHYNIEYYLTVMTSYGTSSGEGWYPSGSITHAGLDVYIVAGLTGERFAFQNWSSDASGLDYSQSDNITMDGPKTALAIWATEYYLEVISAHGTVSGSGWHISGTTVYVSLNIGILATAPGERYMFLNWTGDSSGTDYSSSSAIVMNGPKTVVATWQTQYRLTCTTNPSGLIPVPISTPSGEWFANGTVVTLEAQDISGYTFDYWETDGSAQTSGISLVSVTMSAPHSAIAFYTNNQESTTTTTSTSPPQPQDLSPILIVILGAGVAAVIIVVVIALARKRS